MELIKPEIIVELKKRREYCYTSISGFNKKLPKKLLIYYGIGLLYACIRMEINPEENISFYTTLTLITCFFTIIVLVNHALLLIRIKKDIKNLDAEINELENNISIKGVLHSL